MNSMKANPEPTVDGLLHKGSKGPSQKSSIMKFLSLTVGALTDEIATVDEELREELSLALNNRSVTVGP